MNNCNDNGNTDGGLPQLHRRLLSIFTTAYNTLVSPRRPAKTSPALLRMSRTTRRLWPAAYYYGEVRLVFRWLRCFRAVPLWEGTCGMNLHFYEDQQAVVIFADRLEYIPPESRMWET